LADLYEILRQRVLGSDSDFAGAKADLDGVFQKLERLDLKAAMTEIAQKMANNEASPADIARYRELGEKLAKG
jgi:DNA primase